SSNADGMPTEQTMCGASSANDHAPANLASQMRVACSSMLWNTGARSPGELEMTFNTSAVAFSRSIASFSFRVRVSSFSCRLATEERPWRAALGELRFGFVVLPGRVLADFRLTVRRRLTERSPGPTTLPLPHHKDRCASQQNRLPDVRVGSDSVIRRCWLD